MKTKLEMAHEWYLKHLEVHESASVHGAWQYVDAMQAEAEKRKPSGLPESLRERHDFTEAIAKGVENYEKEEWQPDWSQAPDVATYWTMRQDGECLWWKGKPLFDGSCFYDAVGICHTVGYAPSFGYTGDWRNSLRKRPQ